ncbi:MAG: MATE family efflux transporter, partial [Spirochaetota bacterium]
GIGTATTTLVGQSLGAGKLAQARHYTRLILGVALGFSGFISLWFVFAPDLLIEVFITDAMLDPEGLRMISRKMLRLTAFYLMADALGAVIRGALNGAGDTFAVMCISSSMHILLLIGSVVLLKVLGLGAIAIWMFFVLFILFFTCAFVFRYLQGHWTRRWQDRSAA